MPPPKLNLTALEEFKALLREKQRLGWRGEQKAPSVAEELDAARWAKKEADPTAEAVLRDYVEENALVRAEDTRVPASEKWSYHKGRGPERQPIDMGETPPTYLGSPAELVKRDVDAMRTEKGRKAMPGYNQRFLEQQMSTEGMSEADSRRSFDRYMQERYYPLEKAPFQEGGDGYYSRPRETSFWRAVEDPDVLPMKTPVAPRAEGEGGKVSDFKRALLWAAKKADTVLPDTAENPEWLDTLVTGSPMASSIGLESNEAKRARRAAGRGQLEDAVDAATTPEGLALWRLLSKVR